MSKLLGAEEPSPFSLYRSKAESAFLLTGDHAGNLVPKSLEDLGLPLSELARHIGLDIGVYPLGKMLADRLDATFLSQPYSRLVIDCNRPPHQFDSIPEKSDGTPIPGNIRLDPEARRTRVHEIFDVYHTGFSAELDRRLAHGQRTIIVALHSFTPVHGDFPAPRPWHIGVLWNRDDRLGRPLLERLREQPDIVVGENEPYSVSDQLDYAIPVHGEARGIMSVELEVRQDLLSDASGCADWADRIAAALPAALNDLDAANVSEVVE